MKIFFALLLASAASVVSGSRAPPAGFSSTIDAKDTQCDLQSACGLQLREEDCGETGDSWRKSCCIWDSKNHECRLSGQRFCRKNRNRLVDCNIGSDIEPNQQFCKLLLEEDFEGADAAAGWTNGQIDQDGSFSNFLGRYGQGESTSKTFFVGTKADSVKVEFLFYEIDSWDADFVTDKGHPFGPDNFFVDISGAGGSDQIGGLFSVTEDENNPETTTTNGVTWSSYSLAPPSQLGFSSRTSVGFTGPEDFWEDQKHRFQIEIPSSFYAADGYLTLKFTFATTMSIPDESGGIDDLKISTCVS